MGFTISCGSSYDQSTPDGYVRNCVRLLDKEALYADSPEWQLKKKEVLAATKTVVSMDEAHSLVQDAAKVAGGKHSFLMAPVKDNEAYTEDAPTVEMLDGEIAYVCLPAHSGEIVSDSLYIHTVLDYLQAHIDAKGVVVDLRDNTGGNMNPMIASVSPLVPGGIVLKFKGNKKTSPISLEYILNSYGIAQGSIVKFPGTAPIAVLTNGRTGSSGEATLLCFRGLENVRTFGSPTAGYASGNMTHILADDYVFAITMYCDVARTGEVFCEDPILPDVETESPLEDAVSWIKNN